MSYKQNAGVSIFCVQISDEYCNISQDMNNLLNKQNEFKVAIEKYETNPLYKRIELLTSVVNVSFQFVILVLLLSSAHDLFITLSALVLAYILADFINGLVHLHMDNIDAYQNLFGPLIAKFHLHHKKIKYITKPIYQVYFFETGSKLWLLFVSMTVVLFFYFDWANIFTRELLSYFVLFSSLAEISHYLAHNSKSKLFLFLTKIGLLLSPTKHARHHLHDNQSYCFLNAICDPVVDRIAKRFYSGYKKTTDLHYK